MSVKSKEILYSDLVAGYVSSYDPKSRNLTLKVAGRQEILTHLHETCFAQMLRNLEEPYEDCTARVQALLKANRYLFAYGIFYPVREGAVFEVHALHFFGPEVDSWRFDAPDWWIHQIHGLSDYYLRSMFEQGIIDYSRFRTVLGLKGEKIGSVLRQETNSFSRFVGGFATAYLMTGEEVYLEGAEKGVAYLQDHMRFYDHDEELIYWYHGIDIAEGGKRENKIFACEYGDDFNAIAICEQIYALAGLAQTYRINGDRSILRDIEMTVDLFNRFYLDEKQGGYFSHLDPLNLDPRAPSLNENRARKNWNSIGDHAPVYLINLYLATHDERYALMLENLFDLIVKYFVSSEKSPFVLERFHEDWSADQTYMWQQNYGVVGHNLKIIWNLMRMHALKPKKEYLDYARSIGKKMAQCGCDVFRGGWYDVMERSHRPGEDFHRFAFHDRKAWWQQEQGILAYQLLGGYLQDAHFLQLAKESSAFYNTFFLDHEDGGIYFNVLANGIPYLLGTERLKSSRWMSACHAFELAYLAQAYSNLLINKQPLELYFKPKPDGFRNRKLYVSPDIFPKNSVILDQVWIDGKLYDQFDRQGLCVELPQTERSLRVKVKLVPKT